MLEARDKLAEAEEEEKVELIAALGYADDYTLTNYLGLASANETPLVMLSPVDDENDNSAVPPAEPARHTMSPLTRVPRMWLL